MRRSPNRSRLDISSSSSKKQLHSASNQSLISSRRALNPNSYNSSIMESYSQQDKKQLRLQYKEHCNKVEILTSKGFVSFFKLEEIEGTHLLERLYACFAPTGSINMKKFFNGINVLSNGSLEDRLLFFYTLFDSRGTGRVEKSDMKKVLLSLLNAMIKIDFERDDIYDLEEEVRKLTKQEWEEAIEEILSPYGNVITFEEFADYVNSNPEVRKVLES